MPSVTDILNSALPEEVAQHIIQRLSRLNIPATAENYTLWYEYESGTNLDLKLAIERLLENDVTFTQEVNQALYKNFVRLQSPQAIKSMQMDTHSFINSLLDKLARTKAQLEPLSLYVESCVTGQDDSCDEKTQLFFTEMKDSVEDVQHTFTHMMDNMQKLKLEMERINLMAITDPVTNLPNRRSFESELTTQLDLYAQMGQRCSLLLVNVDHFSLINQTYGAPMGDQILNYISKSLRSAVRGDDYVSRYSEEEFAILLPNTKFQDVLSVAENLRLRVSQLKFKLTQENQVPLDGITVSIGLSTTIEEDNSDRFFSRARRALWQAKSEGRNCVRGE